MDALVEDYKYKFEVQPESKLFKFAGMVFDKFKYMKNVNDVYNLLGIKNIYGSPKDKAKAFTEHYKITPTVFKKKHNGVMKELWVDPVKDYYLDLAFSYKRDIDKGALLKLHKNKELLDQASKDGMKNVIPLINYLGEQPSEIKRIVGKGLWKKLCKNSFTRNLYISKKLDSHISVRSERDSHQPLRNTIQTLLEVKIELMKYQLPTQTSNPYELAWLSKNFTVSALLKSDNNSFIRSQSNNYSDTKSMARQLGRTFSEDWTPVQMHKKHEDYTKLINLRKYSPETISCLKSNTVQALSYKGFTANLLQSPLDIRTEGDVMKHCVGGYSSSVVSGDYLVYSITSEGKRYSTLGINTTKVGNTRRCVDSGKVVNRNSFSQHYKHCNESVDNEDVKELATLLIKALNNNN